jgi:hypothetical protein
LPQHRAGVIREHQLVAVVVERNILIFLFWHALAKSKVWFAFTLRVRHGLHNKLCYLSLNPSHKL